MLKETANRRVDRHNEAGVTLIELLVVVLIIGLLAVVVVPNVFGVFGQAKDTAAKQRLEQYAQAIRMFSLEQDRVPTTEEGLAALEEMDYIDKVQLDPWGEEFQYMSLSRSKFRLYSFGADGVAGGEGEDADIMSDASEPLE